MRKSLAGCISIAAVVGCIGLAADYVTAAFIPSPASQPSVALWPPLLPEAQSRAESRTDQRRTATAPAGLRG
jgi:hypothetical protein